MKRVVMLLLLLLAVPVPAHAQRTAVPQVVVVGVPGLRWSDVDPASTPALARLSATGAVGALSVKAAPALSCAADGFLTLGAGARAEAFGTPCGDDADLSRLDELRRRNLATRERARVGLLGERVRATGACTAGGGQLAALATGDVRDVATSTFVPDCPLVVLQTADVMGEGATRAKLATQADFIVGAADAARAPGSVLLVVGVSGAPGDDVAHLHVAVAAGLGRGGLTSASTRRDDHVQLIDVAPTALSLLGIDVPDEVAGQAWRRAGPAASVADLADLDTRAVAQKAATVPFFVVVLAAQLVLLVGLWRRRAAAHVVGLAGAAVPAASFLAGLVPWWRVEPPLLGLLGATAAATALLVALARSGPWRSHPLGPVGAVCAATLTVLVLDLLTGAHLQVVGPAGYSPLVAGRFAGIGNVAFGVLAAAALLVTACAAAGRPRRTTIPVVASVGLATVAVDGAPPWGSDVGGVLALLPAFALLGLLLTGSRVSALRLALAGGAGVAVVTVLALADRARAPQDRTHLGRFAEQVADGTAGAVLQRKAEAVFGLLFSSPVTALLPLVVAAAVWIVVRPPASLQAAFEAQPAWRHGLVALGLACAIGFAVNDSGAAVPALALVVALPATAAVVARVSADREATDR